MKALRNNILPVLIGIIIGAFLCTCVFLFIKSTKSKLQQNTFLKEVEGAGAGGIGTAPYVDFEALTRYTCDEVFDVLYSELLRVTQDKEYAIERFGGQYCYDLCLALIDKCQSRGVSALLKIYMVLKGNKVKAKIARALAVRKRDEAVDTLIEGIREETDNDILSSVDWELNKLLPGIKRYESDSREISSWQELYQYWKDWKQH